MTTTSRIRIRAGTPADLDALTELHFDAFEDNVMSPLMYPNGPSEDCKAKFRGQLLPPPAAQKDKKKGEPFLYVAELLPEDGLADGLPEIVAMAKGTIYREQRPEEEWKAPLPPITADDFGEGADIAVVNAFIGQLNLRQQELAKGEAMLYLGLLGCKQDRQRLGAGSALLKLCADIADDLGLPCRLEASPAGYALYRKFGYEDVGVEDLHVTEKWGVVNTDGSNWGGNHAAALIGPAPAGVMRNVIMRRPPKKPTA
ncbi:N-acetyltransferase-like protein [Trichocladium antarcticum]|uniref:N-acetyltransferase-like protein n=1 Tax=Trichocladium antarcticum TaxID=1450529 RepID=A0AAN6ZC55_9PEZI|nr:N-acetyltransferase-like protein [Trichocladium antarcticum]